MTTSKEKSGRHHRRSGPSEHQITHHFPGGQSITYGSCDEVPTFDDGDPFLNQADAIDVYRRILSTQNAEDSGEGQSQNMQPAHHDNGNNTWFATLYDDRASAHRFAQYYFSMPNDLQWTFQASEDTFEPTSPAQIRPRLAPGDISAPAPTSFRASGLLASQAIVSTGGHVAGPKRDDPSTLNPAAAVFQEPQVLGDSLTNGRLNQVSDGGLRRSRHKDSFSSV